MSAPWIQGSAPIVPDVPSGRHRAVMPSNGVKPVTPPTISTEIPHPSVTQRTAKEVTLDVSGATGNVPFAYGRVRTGGGLLYFFVNGNDFWYVLGLAKGEDARFTSGPIDSLQALYLPWSQLSVGSGNSISTPILNAWFHNGALTQTVDPHLAAVDASWNEDLVVRDPSTGVKLYGISYEVVQLINVAANWSEFPKLVWELFGRRVLDPRTGTVAYSDRTVLEYYDWLRDPDGKGLIDAHINNAAIQTAANIGDQTLGDGSARYVSHLMMDSSADVEDWVKTWRLLCDGRFWYFSQNQWYLVLDRPGASVATYDDSVISTEHAIRGERAAPIDRITEIAIEWTDVNNNWQSRTDRFATPGVLAGTEERKTATYKLPWIHDYGRVQRIGTYLLYSYVYDFTTTCTRGPATTDRMIGDIHTQSIARRGIGAQVWNLLSRTKDPATGCYEDVLLEYNIAKFSDAYASASAKIASTLPDPSATPPDVTGFSAASITEELYQDNYGTWISRARVAFTFPSNYPWLDAVELSVSVNGGEYRSVDELSGPAGGAGVLLFNNVMDVGVPYSFKLVVRSKAIIQVLRSAGVIATKTLYGKTAPPSDVLGLTGTANGNQLYLMWQPSSDKDVVTYELRLGLNTDTWATARFLAQTNVTHWFGTPTFGQQSRVFVKAVAAGQYSTNAAVFDVTPNSFGATISEGQRVLIPDSSFTRTAADGLYASGYYGGVWYGSGQMIIEAVYLNPYLEVPDPNEPCYAQKAFLCRSFTPATAETERSAGSYSSVGAWASAVDDPRRGGAPLWAPLPANASGEIWGSDFFAKNARMRLREHRTRLLSVQHSGRDTPNNIALAQPFYLDASNPTVRQYGDTWLAPAWVDSAGIGLRLSSNSPYYQQVVSSLLANNIAGFGISGAMAIFGMTSTVQPFSIVTGAAQTDVTGYVTVPFSYPPLASHPLSQAYKVDAIVGSSAGYAVVVDHLDAAGQTVRFASYNVTTGALAPNVAFVYEIKDNGASALFTFWIS